MLHLQTSVVIPVELSAETKIPNGPFPAGWLQLGKHYPPNITQSSRGSEWKTIFLGEPCGGPLILELNLDDKGWKPKLLCGCPRGEILHNCNFDDYWQSPVAREVWPEQEISIRIARWIYGAARGHDKSTVVTPFVIQADCRQVFACLPTGLTVTINEQTDLPVLLALVSNRHLMSLALEAADILLTTTWGRTERSSREIAALRGFRQ